MLVDWMKEPSNTYDSFAYEIGVNVDTLYEWNKVHPEFSDAKKRAREAAMKSMSRLGLAGMGGKIKGFGQAAWIFWMKARFGWREDGPMEQGDDFDLEFTE
jgi:hypothetical protein